MVFRFTLTTLLGLSILPGLIMAIPTKRSAGECTPFTGNFGDSPEWSAQEGDDSLYDPITGGLKFNLKKPESYVRKYNAQEKHHYNTVIGQGPTFVYNTNVQYGRISAKIKAPSVAGAVTAMIFKSDDKDEIDFELIAGPDNVQTNYYWGKKVEQGKNGDKLEQSISDDFHTYRIDWSPKSIKWYVDDTMIREKTKASTVKGGQAMYPTSPSQIQIGLWDGSEAAGTAAWAQGPIEWNQNVISAYIKDVTVECPF